MAATSHPEPAASGNHSAQWGLAAMLLGSLILILFPIVIMAMFASMVGAENNSYLQSRDIDLGVTATWTTVVSLFLLAKFALLAALTGLVRGRLRRQPVGLAVGGLVLSVPAVVLSVVLIAIAVPCVEWSRGLQQSRFGPERDLPIQPREPIGGRPWDQ